MAALASSSTPPPSSLLPLPSPLPTTPPPPSAHWYSPLPPSSEAAYKAFLDNSSLLHSTLTKLGLVLTLLSSGKTTYEETYPLLRSVYQEVLPAVVASAQPLRLLSPVASLWSDVAKHVNALPEVAAELLKHVGDLVEGEARAAGAKNQSRSTLYIGQLQTHLSHFLHSSYDPSSSAPPRPRASPLFSNKLYARRSVMSAVSTIGEVVRSFVHPDGTFKPPSVPTDFYYRVTSSDLFNDAIDRADVGDLTAAAGSEPLLEGEGADTQENMLRVWNSYAACDAAFVVAVVSVYRHLHGELTSVFKTLDETAEKDIPRLYAVDATCARLAEDFRDLDGTLLPASLDVEEDGATYSALTRVVETAGEIVNVGEGLVAEVERTMAEARAKQEELC